MYTVFSEPQLYSLVLVALVRFVIIIVTQHRSKGTRQNFKHFRHSNSVLYNTVFVFLYIFFGKLTKLTRYVNPLHSYCLLFRVYLFLVVLHFDLTAVMMIFCVLSSSLLLISLLTIFS